MRFEHFFEHGGYKGTIAYDVRCGKFFGWVVGEAGFTDYESDSLDDLRKKFERTVDCLKAPKKANEWA